MAKRLALQEEQRKHSDKASFLRLSILHSTYGTLWNINLNGITLDFLLHVFFYKKLGSGHSTKSFLISHEILSILVLKVS